MKCNIKSQCRPDAQMVCCAGRDVTTLHHRQGTSQPLRMWVANSTVREILTVHIWVVYPDSYVGLCMTPTLPHISLTGGVRYIRIGRGTQNNTRFVNIIEVSLCEWRTVLLFLQLSDINFNSINNQNCYNTTLLTKQYTEMLINSV